MVKDETILILAGVGIVGYGLLRSDFFKGLGDVGEGVGDAVGGAGTFVRETFVEGASIIREGGETIREVFNQGDRIIQEVGGLGTDILSEDTGARGILQNVGGIGVDVTGFLRNETSQNLNRLGKVDDFIFDNVPMIIQGSIAGIKEGIKNLPSAIPSSANVILGAASDVAKKAAGFLKTDKGGGAEISLPSGQNMSIAPNMSIPREPTLREKISNTISAGAEKAKGFLSSVGSKIRGLF